jgi:hypothetical protein
VDQTSGTFWNMPPELTLLHHLPKRHQTSEQLPCPSSSGDLIGILYGLDWTASMEWAAHPAILFPCSPMLFSRLALLRSAIGLPATPDWAMLLVALHGDFDRLSRGSE